MPNKNYIKGKAKEQRLKKKFQEKGFIVLRSAASKGFADLVAIKKETKEIIFIQSKHKSLSENQRKKLEKEYDWVNDEYMTRFIVL